MAASKQYRFGMLQDVYFLIHLDPLRIITGKGEEQTWDIDT
jgi:hypothetical protein